MAATTKKLKADNDRITDTLELTQEQTITAQILGLHLAGSNSTTPTNAVTEGRRRVTLVKDNMLVYPELWMDVFIANACPYEQRQFAEMFARARCRRAASAEEADLVVFVGGPDVNPDLYNETRHKTTVNMRQRDIDDFNVFAECFEHGIPMFGVCRGAQFIHVMNGGKLYQDVDGHTGDHGMFDLRNKRVVPRISSVHHQMVRANDQMEIIGHTTRSTKRWLNATDCDESPRHRDIEAFFYPDTCAFGVQGHPEYRDYAHFTVWCLEQINSLIVENPDISWVKHQDGTSHYRIKPDVLKQRNAVWEERYKETLPPVPAEIKGIN